MARNFDPNGSQRYSYLLIRSASIRVLTGSWPREKLQNISGLAPETSGSSFFRLAICRERICLP
jgi:hypothetical protein